MNFFDWLEHSAIGTWVRESTWGFPISLILHSWAMALLVGISLAMALSALGMTPRLLPALLKHFRPLVWSAFSISLASGLLLISAYPSQPLTSAVFFSKMTLIALALSLLFSLARQCNTGLQQENPALPATVKWKAAGILLCWFATISTGKLLYYTYSVF